jgi:hypothetical protein
MPTEWIRQRVTPSLVTRYEQEMAKLRGETSGIAYVVGNIKKLNEEVDKIETDEERCAKELAEDLDEDRRFQEQLARERKNKV